MIDAARPTHTGLCDDDGGPEDAASEVESKGSEHPGLRINGERPRWVESSTERAKTSVFSGFRDIGDMFKERHSELRLERHPKKA